MGIFRSTRRRVLRERIEREDSHLLSKSIKKPEQVHVEAKELRAFLPEGERKALDLALVDAAKADDFQTARNALLKGADPNANDRDWGDERARIIGPTIFDEGAALTWAAAKGNTEIVELLILNDADVNIDNGEPLRRAAQYGRKKAVGLLVGAGADVNAQGFIWQQSPLYMANLGGHTQVASLLRKYGAKE